MGKARKDFAYADTAMLPIVEKRKYLFSAWVFSERTDVERSKKRRKSSCRRYDKVVKREGGRISEAP
jgi:hypothetical protein